MMKLELEEKEKRLSNILDQYRIANTQLMELSLEKTKADMKSDSGSETASLRNKASRL